MDEFTPDADSFAAVASDLNLTLGLLMGVILGGATMLLGGVIHWLKTR